MSISKFQLLMLRGYSLKLYEIFNLVQWETLMKRKEKFQLDFFSFILVSELLPTICLIIYLIFRIEWKIKNNLSFSRTFFCLEESCIGERKRSCLPDCRSWTGRSWWWGWRCWWSWSTWAWTAALTASAWLGTFPIYFCFISSSRNFIVFYFELDFHLENKLVVKFLL